MRPTRFLSQCFTITLAVGLLLALQFFPVSAAEVSATTSWCWGCTGTPDVVTQPKKGKGQGEGDFVLGINTANAHCCPLYDSSINGPFTYSYKEVVKTGVTGERILPVTDVATAVNGHTTSTLARSRMIVDPLAADGFFPYKLRLKASATYSGIPAPQGDATARGTDPQPMSEPGVFAAEVALESGSQLFEPRPEVDEARARYRITAFDLAEPMVSIDLEPITGRIHALVRFATDPRLSFLDPETLAPISAEAVAMRLENAAGLGTENGLASDLKLFIWRYDLSAEPFLPPGAALGANGENSVLAQGSPGPVGTQQQSWGRVKAHYR